MPDNGPEDGKIEDVFINISKDGRWGYRVIINSELAFFANSQDDAVDSLEYILPLEFGMLQRCGFETTGRPVDRKTLMDMTFRL